MFDSPARRLMPLTIAIVIAAIVGPLACRTTGPATAPVFVPAARGIPPLLTWLSEVTRPMGTQYALLPTNSALFGSISGLVRDGVSGEWLAVIDERENTRVAWLSIDVAGGQLSATPTRLTMLRADARVPARVVTRADLEGVTRLPDGTFMLVEEGHITKGEVWQPSILQMTRDGLVTRVISFPEKFRVRADQTRGVRDNQGFESLTRTPSGRLIVGLEQPLIEDGPVASFDRGGPALLVELAPRGSEWSTGREWRYQLDPTSHIDGFEAICDGGENGLVELLAMSDTELFSMERACLQNPQTQDTANAIKIFSVELSSVGARKTLLLDLATLTPKLSPALERLDNFEGLAYGPVLNNGSRTLLVVSDDNFRRTQKTSFLLFGLR